MVAGYGISLMVAAYFGEVVGMMDMFDKILDWAGRITFAIGGLIILDSLFVDGAGGFEYVLGSLYFGMAVAYVAALVFRHRWLAAMREDMKEWRRYGDD